MRLVIADTGPIDYLTQIVHIELLPRMFERVALPASVQTELSNPLAPLPVRRWIATPPAWLEIHDTSALPQVSGLDIGESAAIALADSLHADLLLIDERDGYRVAREKGLRVTGTLGLLDLAAERGLVDFAEAIRKLQVTSFRRPEAVLKTLLATIGPKNYDRLELEAGVTPSFSRHHSTEWNTDLLLKKPWTLPKKAELMAGVGPEWVQTREPGMRAELNSGRSGDGFLCSGPAESINSAGSSNRATITISRKGTNNPSASAAVCYSQSRDAA